MTDNSFNKEGDQDLAGLVFPSCYPHFLKDPYKISIKNVDLEDIPKVVNHIIKKYNFTSIKIKISGGGV